MLFGWLSAKEAQALGTALAEEFKSRVQPDVDKSSKRFEKDVKSTLARLERHIEAHRPNQRFNFFQRAKLANSFKWTLREAGYDTAYVDELTEWLVLRF